MIWDIGLTSFSWRHLASHSFYPGSQEVMGDSRFCLVAWNCVKANTYIRMCKYIYIYAQVYIIVGCRSETPGPNSWLPSYWNALPKHKQSAHLPKKDPSDNEFADHPLHKLSSRGGGDQEFCPHFKSLVRWVCKAANCRCFFFQCSLWNTKGAVPLV